MHALRVLGLMRAWSLRWARALLIRSRVWGLVERSDRHERSASAGRRTEAHRAARAEGPLRSRLAM